MRLSNREDVEREIKELQDAMAKMTDPTVLVCLKCKTIHSSKERTRLVCYCDFESDRYGEER